MSLRSVDQIFACIIINVGGGGNKCIFQLYPHLCIWYPQVLLDWNPVEAATEPDSF